MMRDDLRNPLNFCNVQGQRADSHRRCRVHDIEILVKPMIVVEILDHWDRKIEFRFATHSKAASLVESNAFMTSDSIRRGKHVNMMTGFAKSNRETPYRFGRAVCFPEHLGKNGDVQFLLHGIHERLAFWDNSYS